MDTAGTTNSRSKSELGAPRRGHPRIRAGPLHLCIMKLTFFVAFRAAVCVCVFECVCICMYDTAFPLAMSVCLCLGAIVSFFFLHSLLPCAFPFVWCDVYVLGVRVVFSRGHHCDAQVPSTREVKVNWVRPGTVVHESEQVLFIFTHLNHVKDNRFKLQRREHL